MSYVAISNNLKNIQSISLNLMSPEEMLNMSYGEVLTAETINYRTGTPQMNGLFCQAIFGPVKDWECACGKYKRYRYAGVICDKCGVEVTHSSVRRERMGHIALAAPCVHPWFSRIVPSRIALALDMKSTDIQKVTYFSAYVVTNVNEDLRTEYIQKIQTEKQARLDKVKKDFDIKYEELSRDYQKSKATGTLDVDVLRADYDMKKDIYKEQSREMQERISATAENALQSLESIKVKDVMNENKYYELSRSFAAVFKAEIGAEAIDQLLKNIDIKLEIEKLKVQLDNTKGQIKKKIAKRLKLLMSFLRCETDPSWMVLKTVMVLPPELRPMLQLDGGRFAHADLNDLYRRLINRNNRLRKLIQIGAPEVILRNEKRMLQEAVEALIDNSSKGGRQVMAATGAKRALKSLTDILKGKQGRFRQNLLGKRVDYSGRSVIIIGPNLKIDECGIPKDMALELFTPFLIGKIVESSEKGTLPEEYQAFNVHSARRLVESRIPIVYDILESIIKDKFILLNRAPTLHRLSFRAFKPTLVDGKAITLHPLVCSGFNADFDGDQMAVHVPITFRAQNEARELMAASKNLVQVASGDLTTNFSQDILLGIYYMTKIIDEPKQPKVFTSENEAIAAYDAEVIKLNELIKVRVNKGDGKAIVETSLGRILFNQKMPQDVDYINNALDKKGASRLLKNLFFELGQDRLAQILDEIKDLGFKYVTQSGNSMSIFDIQVPETKVKIVNNSNNQLAKIEDLYKIGLMTKKERGDQIRQLWERAGEELSDIIEKELNTNSSVGTMIKSGARGNMSNLIQMAGMRGMSRTSTGEIMELCVTHNYFEGVTGLEYFINARGGRKSLADIALKTADAGYLTRRLVDVGQNLIITKEDCGTPNGVIISKVESEEMGMTVADRVYGRYLLEDAVKDGKVIVEKGVMIDHLLVEKIKANDFDSLKTRAVTHCSLNRGVCRKCFGMDFSSHKEVNLGSAVGVIVAQSLGEPSTQLTMKSKITGGAVTAGKKVDITSGLPRVEEIFESRTPKTQGVLSPVGGVVQSVKGSLDSGYEITLTKNNLKFELSAPEGEAVYVEDGQEISSNDAVAVQLSGEIVVAPMDAKVTIVGDKITLTSTGESTLVITTDPGYGPLVKKGNVVQRGDLLTEGSATLQDVLDLGGYDKLRSYIIKELLSVYTSNAISVNEKHIEIIIRQMCSKVTIVDPGATDYVSGDIVSYAIIRNINQKLEDDGVKKATFKRIVIGISKASLSTESFLSAASFQETSRVLVEAVISGKADHLTGLKENVILGQLVPVGTGFKEEALPEEIVEEYTDYEAAE
ncbi:MAG: DNA-directed RNA polymerase subunit beta' [Patescibacteria group bacterium]